MYKFTDIRGKYPIEVYTKNSIMDVIDKHPDFTIFTYIIKLAEMDKLLDSKQANFTIFAPADSSIKHIPQSKFLNMDVGEARTIVQSSIQDNRIPKELLQDSPAAYFYTLSPQNRLFITNIDGNTRINNDVNVIHFDINCNNGLIHVVDGLLKCIFL
jgi:uncharacterized surface protein with fasciclin (FAS1) repeats